MGKKSLTNMTFKELHQIKSERPARPAVIQSASVPNSGALLSADTVR